MNPERKENITIDNSLIDRVDIRNSRIKCLDIRNTYIIEYRFWENVTQLKAVDLDGDFSREELKQRIRNIILLWNDEDETSWDVAEKILQEIEGRKEHG